MAEPTPNPGSAEARAVGCTCVVIDNHHGRGMPYVCEVDSGSPVDLPDRAFIAIARVENADAKREYADKRMAILADRLTNPVCQLCHSKRKGTHCADCRGELHEDSDGVLCVEDSDG